MATTQRNGLPAFWTTSIAKALSGDQPCMLSPWLAGHFLLDKRPRENAADLATWKVNHTAELQKTVERMKAEGWKCSVERFFKKEGLTAVISGKADIVAQQADKRPVIVDVKTGKLRDSDIVQVLIEMVVIPMAWNAPEMVFNGEVVYNDHTFTLEPKQSDAIKPKLFAMLKTLGSTTRPEAAPSLGNCRFCDVSSHDCPDRVDAEADVVSEVTTLF